MILYWYLSIIYIFSLVSSSEKDQSLLKIKHEEAFAHKDLQFIDKVDKTRLQFGHLNPSTQRDLSLSDRKRVFC